MSDVTKIEQLAAKALTQARQDSCEPRHRQLLEDALTLFTEHRLLGLVEGFVRLRDVELQELLSQQVCCLDLSKDCQKYMRDHGIVYLGEALGLEYKNTFRAGVELADYFRTKGIDPHLNTLEHGWRPPYADDPALRALWDQPIGTVLICHRSARGSRDCTYWWYQHVDRMHYVGGPLRGCAGRTGALGDLHRNLKPGCGLHAAMVVTDWQAPTEVPAEWTDYKAEHPEQFRQPSWMQ